VEYSVQFWLGSTSLVQGLETKVRDNIINKRQLRIAKGNDRHGNQPVVKAKRHYQNKTSPEARIGKGT
jgi:hypothetical protein